jgi:hypothetical protein
LLHIYNELQKLGCTVTLICATNKTSTLVSVKQIPIFDPNEKLLGQSYGIVFGDQWLTNNTTLSETLANTLPGYLPQSIKLHLEFWVKEFKKSSH